MVQRAENGPAGGGVGFPAGSKIGKYEVQERRAIGGQAIVYKCYDPALDRHVAVKQISTHLAEDPKFVERFRREAQILARLGAEQPAIVTIHELIEDERGLFIVMEFVQGHTLETVLHDTAGPVEPKAALQIIWRLAAALHVVHGAGIIHRDIKPSNIIICEGLRPKITDFGVAASQTGQTSMLLGTTKYMAPELFAGGEVDGRVDMYSLGIVAYEMLLGRPKFNEVFEEVVRDPHSEALRWMKWHSNPQVVAPDLHELNASVPAALSDIVATMMAKDRQERFESMEALGRAIRLSFSPRARTAAMAGAETARGSRGRRARPGEEPAAGPESADEGDELEVPSDTAPTAAIPRRRMSTRAKAVLGGGVFAVVLAAVIVLLVQYNNRRAQIAGAASGEYRQAEGLYNERRYAEALEAFQALPGRYPDTRQSHQASVMAPLTRARLLSETARTAEQWQEVAAQSIRAREQAQKVLASRKDLENWARKAVSDIDDFEQDRTRLKRFRTEMARAQEAYQAKQYPMARQILEALTGDLTDAQVRQRDALRALVARADFDQQFAAEVSRADGLAGLDDFEKDADFEGAGAAYQRALTLARSSSALSDEQRTKLGKELEAKLSRLQDKQRYRAAIQEADTEKDLDKKLAALRRADRIHPSEPIKQRIQQLESDRRLQKATEAYNRGDLAAAGREVDEALKANPKNQPAADLKTKIEKGLTRKQLLSDGQKAFSQGEYAEALKKFLEAADIASDEDLAGRIVDCRYQLQLAEGDRLRQAKQYDQAITAYEKARAIKPSEGQVIDSRLLATKTLQEYEGLMVKGEEAMKGRQFGRARGFFTQAKARMETPEVVQRIAEAYYSENLELGKNAMGQRDYGGALAYFKIARTQVDVAKIDPAEVDGLIKQAEDLIKATP